MLKISSGGSWVSTDLFAISFYLTYYYIFLIEVTLRAPPLDKLLNKSDG